MGLYPLKNVQITHLLWDSPVIRGSVASAFDAFGNKPAPDRHTVAVFAAWVSVWSGRTTPV
jgi:hypothetical protein